MADGMMGFDPQAMLKFQLQQEQEKRLMEEAKLTNPQFWNYQAGRAGQQLGKALFGGADVQDPRLQYATATGRIQQQALQAAGGDASSPTFYRQLATGYANAGLYAESAKAAEMAKDLITKAQSVDPVKQAQEARRSELIQQFGPVLGNQKFIEEVNAAKTAQAAAQSGSSAAEQASAKANQALLDRGASGVATEDIVNQMDSLVGTAFTGVGADEKLALGRFANALGINVAGVPESEQLDMIFKSLTLGQAGNLKGALSDKDLAILRETVGTRGLTRTSLQLAFRRMRRDSLIDQNLSNMYNEHLASGKTASSFNVGKERKKAQEQADKQMSDRETKLKRLRELESRRPVAAPAAQPQMGVTPVPNRVPDVNEIPGMNIAP